MTSEVERELPARPWDFTEAVAASRRAAEAQRAGEQAVRDAAAAVAEAERSYRMELAKEIVRQRDSGVPATVAQDLARGQQNVADLRHALTIAEGAFKAAEQRAWRHTADRRDTLEYITWSRVVHARDDIGQQPAWTSAPRDAA